MTTDFIRSTHLARAQLAEYERLAWFLFGSFERERRLYVNTYVDVVRSRRRHDKPVDDQLGRQHADCVGQPSECRAHVCGRHDELHDQRFGNG